MASQHSAAGGDRAGRAAADHRIHGDTELWADWIRNDLDQTSAVWRTAKRCCSATSYVIVWADQFGRPKVTVESREAGCRADRSGHPPYHGRGEAVGDRKPTTEAVLYLPDRIVRLRANQTGATTQGFSTVEEIANPLGVVPVVQSPQHRPHPRRLRDAQRDRRPQAVGRRVEQVAWPT